MRLLLRANLVIRGRYCLVRKLPPIRSNVDRWECHHASLPALPADISFYSHVLSADTAGRLRIRRQAFVADHLRHANIVRLYATDFADDGRRFAVREWCPGKLLGEDLLAPIARDRALGLLEQLVSLVEFTSSRGVILRDLHPDGLLLRRPDDGRESLMLYDQLFTKFAKHDDEKIRESAQGIPNSTYLAPEVKGGVLDERSDVYSVGKIAQHMLSGSPLDQHLGPAPPGVGDRLWSLIARCIASDPTQRPSVRELGAEFAEAIFEQRHARKRRPTPAGVPVHRVVMFQVQAGGPAAAPDQMTQLITSLRASELREASGSLKAEYHTLVRHLCQQLMMEELSDGELRRLLAIARNREAELAFWTREEARRRLAVEDFEQCKRDQLVNIRLNQAATSYEPPVELQRDLAWTMDTLAALDGRAQATAPVLIACANQATREARTARSTVEESYELLMDRLREIVSERDNELTTEAADLWLKVCDARDQLRREPPLP
jgi:hypothetical protein